MAGQWFSPGTPVSSTNKSDRHDITEILLKVALNPIIQTKSHLLPFIDMSRRGRFEETPLRDTCEVPVYTMVLENKSREEQKFDSSKI